MGNVRSPNSSAIGRNQSSADFGGGVADKECDYCGDGLGFDGTDEQVGREYRLVLCGGDDLWHDGVDPDSVRAQLDVEGAGQVHEIDTAQYYGPSVVNELIREVLHPYPSNLAIVSKVAARRDTVGAVLPYDEPDQLRAGIEDNLTTLGADRLAAVNLRLVDGSSPGERFDAQLAALVAARDEGLIDGIGLSNVSRAHLLRAVAQTDIVCVQNLFNLVDQRSLDVLEECRLRAIAFVPFCPLGWPRGARNAILTSPVLAGIGNRLGATVSQIALAWLLDLAPNILLIPGTRTRRHLAENIHAAGVDLDDTARAELSARFPTVSDLPGSLR